MGIRCCGAWACSGCEFWLRRRASRPGLAGRECWCGRINSQDPHAVKGSAIPCALVSAIGRVGLWARVQALRRASEHLDLVGPKVRAAVATCCGWRMSPALPHGPCVLADETEPWRVGASFNGMYMSIVRAAACNAATAPDRVLSPEKQNLRRGPCRTPVRCGNVAYPECGTLVPS